MSIIEILKNKRVLILGFGREGVSTLVYLRKKFPKQKFGVADERDLDDLPVETQKLLQSDLVETFFGKKYLDSVAGYDLIFKSSGVNPHLKPLVAAKEAGKIFSSNVGVFFEECQGQIIGITGTKGKSTTSTLIYEVLRRGGKAVRFAGNIGKPPLDVLTDSDKKDIFVLELSSFQLMGLTVSPHIAVVQNVTSEHLDYHLDTEQYVASKSHITKFQNAKDIVVYNASYPNPKKFAALSPGRKLPFSTTFVEDMTCFLEGDDVMYRAPGAAKVEKVVAAYDVPLQGRFNLQNVMPAIILGREFGVPMKVIVKMLREFQSLEHRLEFVGVTKNNIAFYNDSLSTTPEATIAALQSFEGKELVLLAGGHERNQDFVELAKLILHYKIKALVLFKTTGARLWEEILKQASIKFSPPPYVFVRTMKSAVKAAMQFTDENDIVLLSPASASFGIFKDYADRGNQFKKAVKPFLRPTV